jgi:hypothetical protein
MEQDFNSLVPTIDKVALGMPEASAKSFLTSFSNYQAEASTAAWKKLGEYLLVKYMMVMLKWRRTGNFFRMTKEFLRELFAPVIRKIFCV